MQHLQTFLLSLMLLPLTLSGQSFKADPTGSKITINGTSSLHDWESRVEEMSFSVMIKENGEIDLKGAIPVKSIKSGKSIMDSKTYDALEADEFGEIQIAGKQLKLENSQVTGDVVVTIKGISKSYKVQSVSNVNGNAFNVSGSIDIDMTAFDIEPPTAMFGSLTTGKDVAINYQIILVSN